MVKQHRSDMFRLNSALKRLAVLGQIAEPLARLRVLE